MVILTETTPDGLGQHEAGAKVDAGKERAHLVLGSFSRALMAVSEVGTFGANKYTDNGWLQVSNAHERYCDAMLRHYLKDQHGEETDPDSGLLHAAHLAWNALATLELILREEQDSV